MRRLHCARLRKSSSSGLHNTVLTVAQAFRAELPCLPPTALSVACCLVVLLIFYSKGDCCNVTRHRAAAPS